MSYDIDLLDPVNGQVIQLDHRHQMKGGTYAIGGTNEASLNVTYNYAPHYKSMGEKGIREIYGKTGAESMPMLQAAIDKLGDHVHDNYWIATEGNAKQALLQLVALARLRPDGIWDGD